MTHLTTKETLKVTEITVKEFSIEIGQKIQELELSKFCGETHPRLKVFVHCQDGVSKSGKFIAIYNAFSILYPRIEK